MRIILALFFCILSVNAFSQTNSKRLEEFIKSNPEHTGAKAISQSKVAEFLNSNEDDKGACIYWVIGTQVCKENVTRKWCSKQLHSQFSENDTCP